jgi:hypothetical protein
MHKIPALLLLLGGLALATPVAAQTATSPKLVDGYTPEQLAVVKATERKSRMVVYHLDLVQMTDEAAAQFNGKERFAKGFQPGAGMQVVAETDLMSMTNKESLVHLGNKNPIMYYDPRASQFQVQYVDVGMKLDVKGNERGNDEFDLDVRPEISVLEKTRTASSSIAATPAAYPQTEVFTAQLYATHVHFGEAILLSRVQGPAAQRFWDSVFGQTGSSPMRGRNLFYFLTIHHS